MKKKIIIFSLLILVFLFSTKNKAWSAVGDPCDCRFTGTSCVDPSPPSCDPGETCRCQVQYGGPAGAIGCYTGKCATTGAPPGETECELKGGKCRAKGGCLSGEIEWGIKGCPSVAIVGGICCKISGAQPGVPSPGIPQTIDFQVIIEEAMPDFKFKTATIGDILSELLKYIFVFAGLILFAYLIWGGFELLTSTGDPESIKKAQGKITHAIIGFIIIFASYWLAQILEIVFGISILG